MTYKTEQEQFWAGDFGLNYIERNKSDELLTSKVAMWSTMLRSAHSVTSACEFGCNIGLNLVALNQLKPSIDLTGFEINETAAKQAASRRIATIQNQSILESISIDACDLTFTVGVLIHINPDYLKNVYDNLVNNSRRYILVSEYYNPSPVAIPYRGHAERLYKRDFAGELMDNYDLRLVDYGFIYKRDNWAPQDDTNWFLLEKQN
ncbi:MAG: pseudaminic acid biosynthesis-associated methylase [Pseudomonadota bacterium]